MVEGQQEVVISFDERLQAAMKVVREQPAVCRSDSLLNLAEPARKERQRQRVKGRDGHDLRIGPHGGLQLRAAGVQHADGFLCRLVETSAFRGERCRVCAAIDERDAEPQLECLDPAAEGGLRHVPVPGRSREGAGSCKAHEVLEPFQFHLSAVQEA